MRLTMFHNKNAAIQNTSTANTPNAPAAHSTDLFDRSIWSFERWMSFAASVRCEAIAFPSSFNISAFRASASRASCRIFSIAACVSCNWSWISKFDRNAACVLITAASAAFPSASEFVGEAPLVPAPARQSTARQTSRQNPINWPRARFIISDSEP